MNTLSPWSSPVVATPPWLAGVQGVPPAPAAPWAAPEAPELRAAPAPAPLPAPVGLRAVRLAKMPALPSRAFGDVPPQEHTEQVKAATASADEKKEDGLSTGAKVAIGVGVVGLVGAVVWALKSSPPAPSAPAPLTRGALPATTPPRLPAGRAPSGSYLANPTSASEFQLREWQDFASTTADPQWLWYLAQSGSAELRQAVAGNRNAPLAVKEFLVRDSDMRVRGKAATGVAYLTRDPAWLGWLAKASFHEGDRLLVQKYIAKNPATPLDVRRWLMQNTESPSVVTEIATRPDLTYEEALWISKRRQYLVRMALAGNRAVAPLLLAALVLDENPFVQKEAIRNPSTPLSAIEDLPGQLHPYASAAREERLAAKKKAMGKGKPVVFLNEPPEPEDTRRPRGGKGRKLPPQPYLSMVAPAVATVRTPPEDLESLVAIFAEARKAALKAARKTDDGGSSNFDGAYLSGPSATLKNMGAAREAKLDPMNRGSKRIDLTNPVYAQGNKRTAQAKAIAEVLNAHGIETNVHYQLD